MKGGAFVMGRKSKYAVEIKEQAVKDYIEENKSIGEIAEELTVNIATIRRWIISYRKYGIEAFKEKARNKAYSKELKEAAIQDYLAGEGSLRDIQHKYDISSDEVLRKWINKYNRLEAIEDYNPKGEVYMRKSRKTSTEERQEIVDYCIEQNNDYKGTAERYEVSYAQVYQWVKKYNEQGIEGLEDKRGKRREEESLNEVERLQRKVQLLQRQLELKERENIVLKKVKEIERRRFSPKSNKKRNT